MKTIFMLLIVLMPVLLFSQGKQAENNWKCLEYEFFDSSVPPPYHYEYLIKLYPDLSGSIKYILGYVENKSPVYKYDFSFSRRQYDHILKTIRKSDILKEIFNSYPKDEWTEGGTSDHFRLIYNINDNPDTLEINEHPSGNHGKNLESLYEKVIKAVPVEIMDELKNIREEYIKSRKSY